MAYCTDLASKIKIRLGRLSAPHAVCYYHCMMKNNVIILLIAGLLFATGCSFDSTSDGDKERLAAPENEVLALKQSLKESETVMKEELASIKLSLETIREIVEMESERAKAFDANRDSADTPESTPTPESSEKSLNDKAKTFVDKNLDRLMDLTQKLLDKMEKELDKRLNDDPPAPQGDQI